MTVETTFGLRNTMDSQLRANRKEPNYFSFADDRSRARLLPLAVSQLRIAALSVHLHPIRVPFPVGSLRSESLVFCNRKNFLITSAQGISLLRLAPAAACRRCCTAPGASHSKCAIFPDPQRVARLSQRRRIRGTDCAPTAKRLRIPSGQGGAH